MRKAWGQDARRRPARLGRLQGRRRRQEGPGHRPLDPRTYQAQLLQAQATQAKDEATLANARIDLQRYETLIKQDAATQQQVDTQKALVNQLAATVKADEAAVKYAQVQLDYTTITAPISGRVGTRLVDPGNIVHAADTTGLVVINQIDPISVLFTLPETPCRTPTARSRRPTSRCREAVLARRQRAAGRRHADAGQQPDRHDQRHRADEGELPESAAQPVAGPVRQRAPDPGHLREGADHPERAVQRSQNGVFVYSSSRTARRCATSRSRWCRSRTASRSSTGPGRHRQGGHRRQYKLQAGLARRRQAGSAASGARPSALRRPRERRSEASSSGRSARRCWRGDPAGRRSRYPLLPVAPLPQVDFPTIQVSANLPGASPETMASNVAQPLERQFSLIAGLTQMTSTSGSARPDHAAVRPQPQHRRAAQDVQAAINAATGQLPTNLPSAADLPQGQPGRLADHDLAVHSDTLPLTEVDDYADNILAQQISQINGVGQVNIGGQQKPAVRVQVDPAKLAALGISLEDIAASSPTPRSTRPRARSTARTSRSPSTTTTSCSRPRPGTT
jgi:HAE1 family hydrophobic/amphiphilic exporter-1